MKDNVLKPLSNQHGGKSNNPLEEMNRLQTLYTIAWSQYLEEGDIATAVLFTKKIASRMVDLQIEADAKKQEKEEIEPNDSGVLGSENTFSFFSPKLPGKSLSAPLSPQDQQLVVSPIITRTRSLSAPR